MLTPLPGAHPSGLAAAPATPTHPEPPASSSAVGLQSRRERYERQQLQMLLSERDRLDSELFALAARKQDLERRLADVEGWIAERRR